MYPIPFFLVTKPVNKCHFYPSLEGKNCLAPFLRVVVSGTHVPHRWKMPDPKSDHCRMYRTLPNTRTRNSRLPDKDFFISIGFSVINRG